MHVYIAQAGEMAATCWHMYIGRILMRHQVWLIGGSLSKPHTSGTALWQMCVLAAIYTINFKWANLFLNSRRSNSWVKDYCEGAASMTCSGDDRSWSMHGNLLLVCAAADHQRQVDHRHYKFNMNGRDGGCRAVKFSLCQWDMRLMQRRSCIN